MSGTWRGVVMMIIGAARIEAAAGAVPVTISTPLVTGYPPIGMLTVGLCGRSTAGTTPPIAGKVLVRVGCAVTYRRADARAVPRLALSAHSAARPSSARSAKACPQCQPASPRAAIDGRERVSMRTMTCRVRLANSSS
jgi:hypothetical protein